jgi:pimeloyl-ACP methyl ester carboxylesterase
MYILRLFLAAVLLPGLAGAQQHVSFSTQDGGVVHADVYGRGDRGLVLAHGGRFNKESWKEQAPAFLNAGFCVLAINFRGAKTVSIVGASFGGEVAADTSIDAEPGEIDRLVLLAAWTDRPPEKIKGRKLFIVARDDANDEGPRLPKIRANFEKASGPKELLILDGSAHAQFLFATDQRDRLLREILHFLAQP